jgi:acyl-CoA reductase-like NAD-dependent aldehyde dehydrogenase
MLLMKVYIFRIRRCYNENNKNFINGEYEEPQGEPKYEVYNPAKSEIIEKVAKRKKDELDRAIDLFYDAQKEWERTTT